MGEETRVVERFEDMSRLGRLQLLFQPDGDVIVHVLPDPDEARRAVFGRSVEFCSRGGGGGRSPHTLYALRQLGVAIERDNQESPIRPGPAPASLLALASPDLVFPPFIDRMAGYVNIYRAGAGKPPVAPEPTLNADAQGRASWMAAYKTLKHADLARLVPGRAAAEDIAAGYLTPRTVMAAFEADPPHREILLGPYTAVGFGFAIADDGVPYWSIVMGG